MQQFRLLTDENGEPIANNGRYVQPSNGRLVKRPKHYKLRRWTKFVNGVETIRSKVTDETKPDYSNKEDYVEEGETLSTKIYPPLGFGRDEN